MRGSVEPGAETADSLPFSRLSGLLDVNPDTRCFRAGHGPSWSPVFVPGAHVPGRSRP
jgi:hypothetical protein